MQDVDISGAFSWGPFWPSDAVLLTNAMAATNPNTPYIGWGNVAQDIAEVPGLVKSVGDLFYQYRAFNPERDVGEANFLMKFGIQPTLDDLHKLIGFVDAVEKRRRALEELRTKGLRRQYTFTGNPGAPAPSHGWFSFPNPERFAYGSGFYQDDSEFGYTLYSERKSWVSCRWIPQIGAYTDKIPPKVEAALSASGALDGRALWQIIPWTWVLNWFTNLNSQMNATANAIPVTCTLGSVMDWQRTRATFRDLSPGLPRKLTFSGRPMTEQKVRRPYANPVPSPQAYIPFLDAGQLSILGSFFTTRARIEEFRGLPTGGFKPYL